MKVGTGGRRAAWSALIEPQADHPLIIEALLEAGADRGAVRYPTGNEEVDELLRWF